MVIDGVGYRNSGGGAQGQKRKSVGMQFSEGRDGVSGTRLERRSRRGDMTLTRVLAGLVRVLGMMPTSV